MIYDWKQAVHKLRDVKDTYFSAPGLPGDTWAAANIENNKSLIWHCNNRYSLI